MLFESWACTKMMLQHARMLMILLLSYLIFASIQVAAIVPLFYNANIRKLQNMKNTEGDSGETHLQAHSLSI